MEDRGETPAPDGMIEGSEASVYLTAIEDNAIVRIAPGTKNIDRVIRHDDLSWPDSLAWGPDGWLYVTTSRIHEMPRFNNGKSVRKEPYGLWKVPPAPAGDETAAESP